MSWDKGFNFRGTSGYVTDGANETYVLTDSYPTVRNGVTFGWLSAVNSVDRDNTFDRRIAGINYFSVGTITFQIDLIAAGTFKVQLAMGDNFTHLADKVIFKDGSTALLTIGPIASLGNAGPEYYDATGTSYTNVTWPGSQAYSADLTFAGTVLNVECSSATDVFAIAHVFVSQVGAAARRFLLVRH